jgi:hypothetical protein
MNEVDQNSSRDVPSKIVSSFCTQLEDVLPKCFLKLSELITDYYSLSDSMKQIESDLIYELEEAEKKNIEILQCVQSFR